MNSMFILNIIVAFCVLCIIAFLVYVMMTTKGREMFGIQNNKLTTNDAIVPDTSNDNLPVQFLKKEWEKICKRLDEHDKRIVDLQNQVSKLNNTIISTQNSNPAITKPSPDDVDKSKKYSNKDSNRTAVLQENSNIEALVAHPQSDSEYKYLRVVDGGKLMLSPTKDNTYYRAWMAEGVLYYEFSSLKVGKAINNRTSIIEPFCDIYEGSIEPDKAVCVETKTIGILNSDFSINKKTLIIYK